MNFTTCGREEVRGTKNGSHRSHCDHCAFSKVDRPTRLYWREFCFSTACSQTTGIASSNRESSLHGEDRINFHQDHVGSPNCHDYLRNSLRTVPWWRKFTDICLHAPSKRIWSRADS